MTARARHCAFAALLALSVGVVGTAPASAGGSAPDVQTQAPTPVTSASAVFHGLVNPRTRPTTYWFELGTTPDYGTATNPASAGKGDKPVTVTAGLGNLQPETEYHVRLVASNDRGVSPGADVTFTTAAASQPSAEPLPAPAAPSPLPGTELEPAPAATPVLGRSVTLVPKSGTVLVRVPGATNPAALADGASVPVGSIVDTRAGTVALRTALPGAATQTGTFHGGRFEVRQPSGGHGMTELVVRGALPTCPAGGARAAAASRRRPPRSLWGHDSHGHFRTRASNSVITVRGTTWFVSDRCDGTLTRVTSGSVAVRDLHTGRTVVLHAGQRHLARRVG
ncbi:MAG TPA: fibronectin type III domain-containing protein [Solirubrobacteraceae bacterium]